MTKKVTVLCHDLSNNCLGRAWVLARLSMADYSVEIIGPSLSGGIWAPLADQSDVCIRELTRATRRSWADEVDGDILVAVKPRADSLTLALRAAAGTQRPVVADVDDWEMAFYYDYPARFAKHLIAVASPRNVYRTLAAENRVRFADAVTVSSTWLQNRFGGEIIPHARDARAFDPARWSREHARAELGVADSDVVIMYIGTMMRHKGVNVIFDAMKVCGRRELVLAAPGEFTAPEGGIPAVRRMPKVSLARLPGALRAADMIVLPQQRTKSTLAQVPAKIFDALAMGLPVITTDVSDLKAIVGPAGIVVQPDDVASLAAAIDRLAADPALRADMGRAARQRFLENFCETAVLPRWRSVLRNASETAMRHA